jgi:hypothetical protein
MGAQMADALSWSTATGWQHDMIEKYGERVSHWERNNLWRRIRPYDVA